MYTVMTTDRLRQPSFPSEGDGRFFWKNVCFFTVKHIVSPEGKKGSFKELNKYNALTLYKKTLSSSRTISSILS
jgi:hypothetical protein